MNRLRRPLLFAALLGSGGCIDVRVTSDELCLSRSDVPIEPGSWNISQSFDVGDALGEVADVDGEVHFVRARLTAITGVDDFDWLDAATVHIASGDPESTLPVIRLVSCSDDDCPREGRSIDLPAESDPDALDYVASGSLGIDLDIEGAPPDHDWTTDIDVCLGGSFHTWATMDGR